MPSQAYRRETTQQSISYLTTEPHEDRKLTLLCVHGWACQASNYSYLFNELLRSDESVRFVAIDLPGHGESSTEKYPAASIKTFAQAVLDVVRELRLEDVVLAGHSMGMRVILEAWEQARKNGTPVVSGLVLLDGSHYRFRKSLFPFDNADARSTSLSPDEKRKAMAHAFTIMFSSNTPADFQASTLAHVRKIDTEYNEAMRKSHIAYDFEQLDDVLDRVGESGIPVLNLQATKVDEHNKRIPLQKGEMIPWMKLLVERVPQVQQDVVEGSGHFIMVDQAPEVAKRVKEFVADLTDNPMFTDTGHNPA